MRPAVVFPLHDPEGAIFPHLGAISPALKSIFSRAYAGVTPVTCERCPEQVGSVEKDGFFTLFPTPPGALVGEQFLHLYRQTALEAHPSQVLHLCFIDRLAFILHSGHQHQFIEDIGTVEGKDTPLIFSRSPSAWASHPHNYYEIEQFATTAGELLFGKRLDFTWCHLAICASRLGEIVTQASNQDLSVLAEITLAIWEDVTMRDVDWLEWEDPFLLDYPGPDLKRRREKNVEETKKRLSYVIPTLQALVRDSKK